MTKISSASTQFYKKLFPLFWFGFLTFFLIGLIKDRVYEKAPEALLLPCIGLVVGFIVMKKLVWDLADEVYDCGEFLFIKKSGIEERVGLSDIMNVSASTNTNPQRITLRLVHPVQLGSEISFSPVVPFITLNPFAKNKIAEDLIVRVDQARIRRQGKSDTEKICRNIAEQHVQSQSTNEFSLEKNTATLTSLIITACAFVYALVDTVFINLMEIVGYPDNKLLLVVLPVAPICLILFVIYTYMVRFAVPVRETIVLMMLCAISLSIAALPLLQRIDSMLAKKPIQTYNYRMMKPGVFEPVEKGPPKLNLRTKCEYWNQFAENEPFQIPLQLGGLGMWQLDGEALDKVIYAYLKKISPGNFIGNFRIR